MQATAILLYAGGAITLLSALVGAVRGRPAALVYAVLGALYLLLARKIQLGRPWARRTVLVLCVIGLALGLLRLAAAGSQGALWSVGSQGALWSVGSQGALWSVGSPVVYAVLLFTPPARAWFRRPDPPAGPADPADPAEPA